MTIARGAPCALVGRSSGVTIAVSGVRRWARNASALPTTASRQSRRAEESIVGARVTHDEEVDWKRRQNHNAPWARCPASVQRPRPPRRQREVAGEPREGRAPPPPPCAVSPARALSASDA
eukprot:4005951-Prymnesium_polylepis.1